MSLVLGVEILGEYKNLTAATKGAQGQLSALNKRTAAISNGMSKAFAAIGVGFSLRVIQQQLEEVSKAAIQDEKSMNLLALAMKNAGNATRDQVAQAEKSISKMQLQSAVADDELRPAFQKLFIATKDVTASNKLLQIALDASAATGKSLDSVSQAMAKSLAGSDTALLKLIPSLRGAKDPLAELERTFAGAAAEAANTDPYQRLNVAFGEIQESIGRQVLPVLERFATFMIDLTPKIQAFFDNLNDPTTETGKSWANLSKALSNFGTTWTGVETKITGSSIFSFLVDGIAGVVNSLNALGAIATGSFDSLQKLIQLDFAGSQNAMNKALEDAARLTGGTTNTPGTIGFKAPATTKKVAPAPPKALTQNFNIKATQSAQQIATTVNKNAKSSGTSVINSLTFGRGGL
jgi:hypothetical protein